MYKFVLLTDGTGQDGTGEITNVSKLQQYLANGALTNQFVRYSPGVGTRLGEKYEGGIFGAHAFSVIAGHYQWLGRIMNALGITNPAEFEISLFGFSRGAFISRILTDMLNVCGVPTRSRISEKMVKFYENKDYYKISRWRKDSPTDFITPSISFVGLWDTVATTMGINEADYESLPENVKAACHAVAINESRPKFNYLKLNLRDDVIEEFFAGCHSDVGGGYGEDQVLSRITLNWMVSHARSHGVAFGKEPEEILPGDYLLAQPHSEHKSESNGMGSLGVLVRYVDLERLNPSVRNLPWDVFASNGMPLWSEDLCKMVAQYNVNRDSGMPPNLA